MGNMLYINLHEAPKHIFLNYLFAAALILTHSTTANKQGLAAFRETSSNADPAQNARIQYWTSKGDARIDYLFDKCEKRIDYLFSRNDERYEIWESHMNDGDGYAMRDARLEHVFSEKSAKKEILFAKSTAKFKSVVAWRNAKGESSIEKIDQVFADSHTEIESAFYDCERKIEILFADIEYTAIHKAVALDLTPSKPSNVCLPERDLNDASVPVEKIERIEYLFTQGEHKIDHLFARYEKRINELFAKNAARLEHLRSGKKDIHEYIFAKIDLASGIRLSMYENAHARFHARRQNMWDKRSTIKFARSIEEIGDTFAEGQKETKNEFLAVDQKIESIFAACKTKVEKLKL
jgi:hypothetical protein